MFIKVCVNQNFIGLDQAYTYYTDLPEEEIFLGQRVLVPFGKKTLLAFVLEKNVENDLDVKAKSILKVLEKEPFLPQDLFSLRKKMEEAYFTTPFNTLSYMLPPNNSRGIYWEKGKYWVENLPDLNRYAYLKGEGKNPSQEKVLSLLKARGPLLKSEILSTLDVSESPIKTLIKNGVIGPKDLDFPKGKKQELTLDQKKAYDEFYQSNKKEVLLFGVTGSGKTELYLHWAQDTIDQGKKVLIVLPEISLTPQMVERVQGRFGKRVSVMHSKLNDGQRKLEWTRVRNNEVDVVVGARSAIFAPIENLGLIIIDEEQESSYQYHQSLRYDVREVAKMRSDLTGCRVVYGSATPEVSLFYRAQKGELTCIFLKQRILNRPLAKVHLVDMRKELASGNISIVSNLLYKKIDQTLKKKKQVILFLNRRGYSNFISCRHCGSVIKCDSCDISMNYHKTIHRLRCHYCGATKPLPKVCPVCGSNLIKPFGIGTQQVEEIIQGLFPEAKVYRMDRDTTSKKESYFTLYEQMKNREIDILIGTQMLAKGLDFEHVTLVGILAAETSLFISDYRAEEQCYALLTQVSGRSGRGENPGEVVLQTYNPDNYAIQYASQGDYLDFYQREIRQRGSYAYPPFKDLITVQVTGANKEETYQVTENFYREIGRKIRGSSIVGSRIIENPKIKNKYTFKFQLKSSKEELALLRDSLKWVFKKYMELGKNKVYIDIIFER